jgi:uncharacterized protein (TIGR02246 family)
MKKLLLCAITIMFGLVLMPAARAGQKEEDAAIRKRHEEWIAAWNKHDPKLMAAFWTADGDLIDPFGKQAQGPQAIEKFFEGEHTGNGVMVGTTYAGTVDNVRLIDKDAAVVDVTAEVSGMKGADGVVKPPLKHHVTWVAKKTGGKWMAIAARPCIPASPPAVPPSSP